MKTKQFKDIELSCLGMGNMRLPGKAVKDEKGEIDWDKSQEILDYAMAHGINYYDTAYVYNNGESERCVGHCMKKYPRDSFYLATKFHIEANPDYKQVWEQQLERLQTDYIDFYLIHCILDSNVDQYIESGAIEFFLDLQKQGKIKYLGFSSHASVKNLTKFADHHQWDFAQIQLNYYDWINGSTKEEYKVLDERNIPIMVMEPVRGGRLADLTPETNQILKDAHADWSVASWALRFASSLPRVQVVLSGMSNMEQIVDNVNTFSDETPFTEADQKLLFEVCEKFRSQLLIPCTACRYCTDGCPMQINIPEYLKIYNNYKVNGEWALHAYGSVESEGTPDQCINCGACMGHCPQHIEIPTHIQALAAVAKKN